ncbi:hypothetical protein FQN50_004379, partial [Emmonsiellopsis sp. PD_5]
MPIGSSEPKDSECSKMNKGFSALRHPIRPFPTEDISCAGNPEILHVCPAGQDSVLNFLSSEHGDRSKPGALDPNRKGACAIYLKEIPSPTEINYTGLAGWFKVWEYSQVDGKWCTDQMIEQGGLLPAKIPKSIKGGYYLLRAEIIDMNLVDSSYNPRYYGGCKLLQIHASGTKNPNTYSIMRDHYKNYVMAVKGAIKSKEQPGGIPLPGLRPIYGPRWNPVNPPSADLGDTTVGGAKTRRAAEDGVPGQGAVVTHTPLITSKPEPTTTAKAFRFRRDATTGIDDFTTFRGAVGLASDDDEITEFLETQGVVTQDPKLIPLNTPTRFRRDAAATTTHTLSGEPRMDPGVLIPKTKTRTKQPAPTPPPPPPPPPPKRANTITRFRRDAAANMLDPRHGTDTLGTTPMMDP